MFSVPSALRVVLNTEVEGLVPSVLPTMHRKLVGCGRPHGQRDRV